jgi:hypothetical protein
VVYGCVSDNVERVNTIDEVESKEDDGEVDPTSLLHLFESSGSKVVASAAARSYQG